MAGKMTGEVALISGGGTGIGRAIALAFAAEGADVAVAGRRLDKLEAVVAEIESSGVRGVALQGDVSQPGDCDRWISEVEARLGSLSILVNNAGVAAPGRIEDASDEDIHRMIDIDLKGPMFLTRAAIPSLRRSEGASILNISSSVTSHAIEAYSVYSAAKAGLELLSKCWARELAADRIRVNTICPGIVDTPVFETMMPREEISGFLEGFHEVIPMGRVGRPADVARAAVFLCGRTSEWTTGAVVVVDGGLGLVS